MVVCIDRVTMVATLSVFIILSIVTIPTNGETTFSKITEKAAKIIEDNLVGLLDSVSGITTLNKAYQMPVGQMVKCIPIDGLSLVQQMATKLDESFERKVTALRKLKQKAEEIVQEYRYDPMLKKGSVPFLNMKTFYENTSTLNYSSRFQQNVSFLESGVHIPLEIYEGYNEILNGLKWSSVLDEVFRNNSNENPDFGWQVFGSQVGFMRVYPANKWKDIPGIPDLYDVRRRPWRIPNGSFDVRGRQWYIQGSTSPKDMLILMDISGSVHGQTFELMKIAVKTMINTLEENDYVNVAWFNNDAGWATCFNTFVQANSWNKKLLFSGIDGLKDGNMSSYSKALQFAFEEFRKFGENKHNNTGAECHQVIMLFTDGGTERPVEILHKYNKNKQIRIFTYAVGPHAMPVHTIKWMACNNKGFFYSISAMGGIRTTVQEYPNILLRPMALSDSQFETWSTVYTDAGGLGMVITVTLPVFNRSEESNQTSLGVVGIDTPVRDIALLSPLHQIGPIGYTFAINPNGFVILHPKMSTNKAYLEDAPDVDFLDLEGEGISKKSLREAMIDGKTGKAVILTFVTTDDDYHIVEKKMNYYYTPIVNSSFGLGLAVPNDRCYMKISGLDHSNGLIQLNMMANETVIANWKFCTDVTYKGNILEYMIALSHKIMTNMSNCEQELVQHLLWDIDRTHNITQHWKTSAKRDRILSVFLATEGGLTRFYPSSEFHNYIKVQDPFQASYYKKAMYYPDWTFVIDKQYEMSEAEGETVLTVVRPVIDGKNITATYYNPAVVGIRMKESTIANIFNLTICKDKDVLTCYLLDDGGFIISSNHELHASKNGKFLGQEDALLMHKLTNISVYKRRLEYEYHSVCTKFEQRFNSGIKGNFIPSITSTLETGFHFVMDILVWLMLSGWTKTTDASGEVGVSVKVANYSCTKARALYYFMPKSDFKLSDSDITCGNCSRKFSAIHLSKTNLLLVIVKQPNCPMSYTCQQELPPLMHQPQETDEPNICAMTPRYRRRPQHCFASHPLEDASICSKANMLDIPLAAGVILAFIMSLWTMWTDT